MLFRSRFDLAHVFDCVKLGVLAALRSATQLHGLARALRLVVVLLERHEFLVDPLEVLLPEVDCAEDDFQDKDARGNIGVRQTLTSLARGLSRGI